MIMAWKVGLKPILYAEDVNKTVVLTTLFLYFVPLLVDYWGLTTYTQPGKKLKHWAGFFTVLVISILAFVSVGVLPFSEKKAELIHLPLEYIYYISGIWIMLAIADWCVSISKDEAKAQLQARNTMRQVEKKLQKETMKKRVKHHQNRKGS